MAKFLLNKFFLAKSFCQKKIFDEKKNAAHKKVKARFKQRKHNLDLNYNWMGFDTIEINLVLIEDNSIT